MVKQSKKPSLSVIETVIPAKAGYNDFGEGIKLLVVPIILLFVSNLSLIAPV